MPAAPRRRGSSRRSGRCRSSPRSPSRTRSRIPPRRPGASRSGPASARRRSLRRVCGAGGAGEGEDASASAAIADPAHRRFTLARAGEVAVRRNSSATPAALSRLHEDHDHRQRQHRRRARPPLGAGRSRRDDARPRGRRRVGRRRHPRRRPGWRDHRGARQRQPASRARPRIDATNAFAGRNDSFESLAHQVKAATERARGEGVQRELRAHSTTRSPSSRRAPSCLYAADDEAREVTEQLIRDAGYDPVTSAGSRTRGRSRTSSPGCSGRSGASSTASRRRASSETRRDEASQFVTLRSSCLAPCRRACEWHADAVRRRFVTVGRTRRCQARCRSAHKLRLRPSVLRRSSISGRSDGPRRCRSDTRGQNPTNPKRGYAMATLQAGPKDAEALRAFRVRDAMHCRRHHLHARHAAPRRWRASWPCAASTRSCRRRRGHCPVGRRLRPRPRSPCSRAAASQLTAAGAAATDVTADHARRHARARSAAHQ